MSENLPLGPGVEFDAIRSLLDTWGPRATGIGDDAAVLRVPRGDSLVTSVDTAVEGQHFESRWLTPREIGYRAVAAALSDIAAMAARPIGVLVAISAPANWHDRLPEIAAGIGDALDAARTNVLGGNLTLSRELSITTTVFGAAFAPLSRSGARPGDSLYVTGRLGGPAAALRRLMAGEDAGDFRDRFAHPVPRLAEARWLSEQGASAGIDISDGLVADLRHMAHASRVSVELDASAVPCVMGVDVELAVQGGEEYELAVSSPNAIDVDAFERRFGFPLSRVGQVVAGPAGTVDVRGIAVANLIGHDHFSG